MFFFVCAGLDRVNVDVDVERVGKHASLLRFIDGRSWIITSCNNPGGTGIVDVFVIVSFDERYTNVVIVSVNRMKQALPDILYYFVNTEEGELLRWMA